MRRDAVERVAIASLAGQKARGRLIVGSQVIPCALGRSGIVRRKREGDGATPAGTFAALAARQRADRMPLTRTLLPRRTARPIDGWCDDPGTPRYNSPVALPFRGSHEALWRDDGVYDLLVVLDFNLPHPAKNRGSAIFLHVADPAWRPTAGCVAIRKGDLRRLLARLSTRTKFVVRS